MNIKQFLRATAFFVCVAVMIVGLCDLFEEANTENSSQRFYKYRSFEENTIDAVMVGTSGTDRYWVPSQAYEKYGMTVYPLSTNGMPVFMYIPLIEEALAYQNPKLIIIDIRPFTQDCVDPNRVDSKARLVLDVMAPFSVNRFKSTFKAMEAKKYVSPDESSFDLSLFFSFIKFHNRWSEKSFTFKRNLGRYPHHYLGFNLRNKLSIQKKPIFPKAYDLNVTRELDPYAEKCLFELLDYIKENNLNVLFLDTPQVKGPNDTGRSVMVYKILEEHGIDCIHYYTDKEPDGITIDFDFNTEFYNNGHTNFYGALKFTDIFAEYLDQNYHLPDRRNDENVKKDWDGVHSELVNKIADLEEAKRLAELNASGVVVQEEEEEY